MTHPTSPFVVIETVDNLVTQVIPHDSVDAALTEARAIAQQNGYTQSSDDTADWSDERCDHGVCVFDMTAQCVADIPAPVGAAR